MKNKIFADRRAFLVAISSSIGLCLYLLLTLLVQTHFKNVARDTFDARPLLVANLAMDLLAAIILRTVLAFARRRRFGGALQLDLPAVAGFVTLVVIGLLFLQKTLTQNIVFGSFYLIPLFFALFCIIRRAPGESKA